MKTANISLALLTIALAITINAPAQKIKKPTEKPSPYHIVLLPDFFHYYPVKNGDTTFSYECYDHDHQTMRVDTLSDLNAIDNIAYVASCPGYTAPGIRPPLLSMRLSVYEKTGHDSWYEINRMNRTFAGYKDEVKTIVRTDTIAAPGTQKGVVIKYYKTIKVDAASVPPPHEH